MEENNNEINLVRDILARELETINNYQNLLSHAQTAEVREFITHVIEEEKEHVAESVELLKALDPGQAAMFEKGDHWRSPRSLPSHLLLETSGNQFSPYTVGSLRKPETDILPKSKTNE